jgi:hypothetical protein
MLPFSPAPAAVPAPVPGTPAATFPAANAQGRPPAAKPGDKFLTQVVDILGPGRVLIRRNLFEVRVRVHGLALPGADDAALLEAARQFTAAALRSEVADFEVKSVNADGEIIASVTTAAGKNVGPELVRAGLARWDAVNAPGERLWPTRKHRRGTPARDLGAHRGADGGQRRPAGRRRRRRVAGGSSARPPGGARPRPDLPRRSGAAAGGIPERADRGRADRAGPAGGHIGAPARRAVRGHSPGVAAGFAVGRARAGNAVRGRPGATGSRTRVAGGAASHDRGSNNGSAGARGGGAVRGGAGPRRGRPFRRAHGRLPRVDAGDRTGRLPVADLPAPGAGGAADPDAGRRGSRGGAAHNRVRGGAVRAGAAARRGTRIYGICRGAGTCRDSGPRRPALAPRIDRRPRRAGARTRGGPWRANPAADPVVPAPSLAAPAAVSAATPRVTPAAPAATVVAVRPVPAPKSPVRQDDERPVAAAASAMSEADRYKMRWVFTNLDAREVRRYRAAGFDEATIRGAANIALRTGPGAGLRAAPHPGHRLLADPDRRDVRRAHPRRRRRHPRLRGLKHAFQGACETRGRGDLAAPPSFVCYNTDMAADVRTGTMGWSYEDWRGPFYPANLPAARMLGEYAKVFDTVELDTTFYGVPRPSTVAGWAAQVPEGFVFSAKVPRAVTHERRLIGAVEQPTSSRPSSAIT